VAADAGLGRCKREDAPGCCGAAWPQTAQPPPTKPPRMRLAVGRCCGAVGDRAAGETAAHTIGLRGRLGNVDDTRGKRDVAAGTWGTWACRFVAQTTQLPESLKCQ
jgi:hypothetical protein